MSSADLQPLLEQLPHRCLLPQQRIDCHVFAFPKCIKSRGLTGSSNNYKRNKIQHRTPFPLASLAQLTNQPTNQPTVNVIVVWGNWTFLRNCDIYILKSSGFTSKCTPMTEFGWKTFDNHHHHYYHGSHCTNSLAHSLTFSYTLTPLLIKL